MVQMRMAYVAYLGALKLLYSQFNKLTVLLNSLSLSYIVQVFIHTEVAEVSHLSNAPPTA